MRSLSLSSDGSTVVVPMNHCQFQKQEHPLPTTKDRHLLLISLCHKAALIETCSLLLVFQHCFLPGFSFNSFLLCQHIHNIQFTTFALFKWASVLLLSHYSVSHDAFLLGAHIETLCPLSPDSYFLFKPMPGKLVLLTAL